jgi:molybdopterin synthase sulfur carrier subunit
MNNIIIPEQLRKLMGGQKVLMFELKDITELIERLSSDYPNVKERLINKNGEFNRFVNVYVNGEDIRFLENITTKLKDGDEISIVPAIASG